MGEFLGFGALTLLIPFIGPLVGLIMAIVWTSKKRQGGVGFLVFTLLVIVFALFVLPVMLAISLPNYVRIKDKAKEAELKQNLHSIQLTLERYGTDYFCYPDNIEEVISSGYIEAFPGNPFNEQAPMKPVADGKFSMGDFVYVPGYPDDKGKIMSYTIKVWGARENEGYILELNGSF